MPEVSAVDEGGPHVNEGAIVKALTVCQPYAEMLARGPAVKPAENRTWSTSYRGVLWIHAGRSRSWMDYEDETTYPGMVFGAIVAVARLAACLHIDAAWPDEYAHVKVHEETNGPWCWIPADMRRLARPVYCRGAQGLWVPSADILQAIRETA